MSKGFRRTSVDFSSGLEGIPLPDLEGMGSPLHSPVRLSENRFASQPLFHSTEPNTILPILDYKSPIPHISPETLVDAINGEMNGQFTNLYIIDCRFGFEYEGGHIRGAENSPSIDTINQKFFTTPIKDSFIVFH